MPKLLVRLGLATMAAMLSVAVSQHGYAVSDSSCQASIPWYCVDDLSEQMDLHLSDDHMFLLNNKGRVLGAVVESTSKLYISNLCIIEPDDSPDKVFGSIVENFEDLPPCQWRGSSCLDYDSKTAQVALKDLGEEAWKKCDRPSFKIIEAEGGSEFCKEGQGLVHHCDFDLQGCFIDPRPPGLGGRIVCPSQFWPNVTDCSVECRQR